MCTRGGQDRTGLSMRRFLCWIGSNNPLCRKPLAIEIERTLLLSVNNHRRMSLKLQTANSHSICIRSCAVLLDNVFVATLKTRRRNWPGRNCDCENSENIELSAVTRVYLFETKQILIVSFILHFSRHRIVLLRVVIFNIWILKISLSWRVYC